MDSSLFSLFYFFNNSIPLATSILTAVGKWTVCKKAGFAGWEGIVPFYNLFVFARIGKKTNTIPILIVAYSAIVFGLFLSLFEKTFHLLNDLFSVPSIIVSLILFFLFILFCLFLISIPIVVLQFMLFKAVAISFGKGSWFALGLVFLPFIFWPILGLDSSVYAYKEESFPANNDGGADVPQNATEVQPTTQ